MKVKLISCKTPTAEHYKVSVVQTAQLIIQMWRISEGDLLSFTADFQGIIHNRAVIRKLWQTQRTGTSAYLPQGFVQDLIIKQLGLSSESKRSHTLQGKSSPIDFMVFYHINPERILDSCILIACCKKKNDWHSSDARDYLLKFRFSELLSCLVHGYKCSPCCLCVRFLRSHNVPLQQALVMCLYVTTVLAF